MEHAPLTQLIQVLEQGTNLHISIFFLRQYGNRKTLLPYAQRIHNRPVCLKVKETPQGLSSCYRCRRIVEKKILKSRKPLSGFCVNGVYEHCRPVIRENEVIGVIYVGNALTDDPNQHRRLEQQVGSELLSTMEQNCTPQRCSDIADILESYILFLFDHYGIDNKIYDPLVENIKQYIHENLFFDLSMKDLAATFNYTEKYLGQVFRQRTGKTIREHCNYLRINRARTILLDTDLSIADVSLKVGFNSTTYFDRVFFKFVGLTPQQYRSTHRSNKSVAAGG